MKKILAILLTVCMVIWMIPAAAFADDTSTVIDLSEAKISIDKNGRDYYIADDTKDTNFWNSCDEVSVKDSNGTDIAKDSYVVKKVQNGSKVRITINFVEGKSTGTTFKDFDFISEILNNTDYFISGDSNSKTATELISDRVYTGAAIKPAVYLYKKVTGNDGKTTNELVSSSKYTVEYSNNNNVGTAQVLIKGTGTVQGEVGGVFAITPADFSNVTVTAADTKNVNVSEYDVIAKLNGNTLKKDTDYTLSFKDSDGNGFSENAFTAGKKYTAVVTPAGSNFKSDSKAKEYSFNVNSELVTDVISVEVKGIAFTYNGQKQVPTVTVKKKVSDTSSQTITMGYTVTYYDASGRQITSPTDAGNYKVVVEAIANNNQGLSGTHEENFTIDRCDVQSTKINTNNYVYISGLTDQKYTGRPLEPSFTVYYKATPSSAAKILTKNTDYTVTYSNNTSIGTGRVTVSFRGNYRNSGSDLTGTFTITNGNLLTTANTIISGLDTVYDYTGAPIKPTVYVTYKSGYTTKTLTQSTTTRIYDYRVDYSSNVAAGTATVTITGQGEYTGTITKTFAIKYNLTNATVTTTPVSYNYDGKAKQPAVTVKVGYNTVPASEYTVTYSNNVNAGTATATVTARKTSDAIGSKAVNFTIIGKDGTITPEYSAFSKKTTKSKPFAIKVIGNTTDGTGYSYTSSDTSVAEIAANGMVTVKGCGKTVITITTTGNKAYNAATATVTVVVKPTKGTITSLSSTSRGKLVVKYKKESPNADYYQIRYGRAGEYDVKSVRNTSSLTGKSTIKGLQSGKNYFVKVRGVKVLEDGTMVYGSWSNSNSVAIR